MGHRRRSPKVPMTWKKKIRNWNYGIKRRGGSYRIPQDYEFPNRCRYCTEKLGPANISLDHNIPIQRGGKEDLTNYDFICFPCNRSKGTLNGVEYRRLVSLLNTYRLDIKNMILKKLRAAWRVR